MNSWCPKQLKLLHWGSELTGCAMPKDFRISTSIKRYDKKWSSNLSSYKIILLTKNYPIIMNDRLFFFLSFFLSRYICLKQVCVSLCLYCRTNFDFHVNYTHFFSTIIFIMPRVKLKIFLQLSCEYNSLIFLYISFRKWISDPLSIPFKKGHKFIDTHYSWA